jgi:tRNA-specific 2-thiouridylase
MIFQGFARARGTELSDKKRILMAMSGGVDSSTAAWLLRQQGHELVGVFMSRGEPQAGESDSAPRQCASTQAEKARTVAEFLEIPFRVVDFHGAFELLITYFCAEYLRGRTPNPCVLCNEQVKFGRLMMEAKELELDYLATGHYVRTEFADGRWRIKRGSDPAKDQSYFLFGLTQEQLAEAIFPLGPRTKAEVRALAARAGLPAAEAEESQDVCFVPDRDYAKFVRGRIASPVQPGEIVDRSGKVIGHHEGVVDFTIGQRRGIGIAAGEPLYVIDIDAVANRVVVGGETDLLVDGFFADNVNWVGVDPPHDALRCEVQIRYRHKAVPSTVMVAGRYRVRVQFDEPQRAVTPGQVAVFYEGESLLGGGWITRER